MTPREVIQILELEQRPSLLLREWFATLPGTYCWALGQIRNYEIIGFYWRFDKWGA